jgi:hypothetical protein
VNITCTPVKRSTVVGKLDGPLKYASGKIGASQLHNVPVCPGRTDLVANRRGPDALLTHRGTWL